MKKLLILVTALWSMNHAVSAADRHSYSVDFHFGMPEEVALYDLDGLAPAADLPKNCFTDGSRWVTYEFGGDDGCAACSTSWHQTPGQADDWMILPRISVEEGATLRWTSRAWDRNLKDGYSIYVSEGGNTPEDFDKSTPLFTIAEESADWTHHSLSLSEYEGKRISIAFVHDSYDCSMLLLSEIFAGTPDPLSFSLAEECFGKGGDTLPLRFQVSTQLENAPGGLKAGYVYGDEENAFEFPDLTLPFGESVEVEFPESRIIFSEGERKPLTVWMEYGGKRLEKDFVVGVFPKRMVAEEATGTWCMWCVRGIVAMEQMKKAYPDDFIGIAVHSGDPMEPRNYTLSVSGYPGVHVNRRFKKGSLDDLEEYMGIISAETPEAIIEGSYRLADRRVSLEATTVAAGAHAASDYQIAVVVTENDVHVAGNPGYSQKNAYAGGGNGPMGGFEDKPEVIPSDEMWYQDVARTILDGNKGIAGSIPAWMNPGEAVTFTHTFDLPSNVREPENTEIILLLLDKRNQQIVNAARAEINDLSGVTALAVVSRSVAKARRAGESVIVEGEGISQVRLFTVDGRVLFDGKADGSTRIELPLGNHRGILVWQVFDSSGMSSGKLR